MSATRSQPKASVEPEWIGHDTEILEEWARDQVRRADADDARLPARLIGKRAWKR